MATAQLRNGLLEAFQDEPNLANALCRILDTLPDEAPVFQALTTYVSTLKSNGGLSLPEHTSKKRKIEMSADGTAQDVAGNVLFSYPDISFSIPVRKKLRLEGLNGGLRGLDAAGNAEATVSWDSIDYVFCLPVPERAKLQHNFVIIPRPDVSSEAFVWTAPEPNPKNPETVNQTYQAMAQMLDSQLVRHRSNVIFPSEEEFVSKLGGNTAAGKSFGTRAHRGSKEGHLFFLSPGIFYGFKKPVLFLPFSSISSISYTSVLQRTFNLVVVVQEPGSNTESEIEFSMLDQMDFEAIDAYVKRHGLNDTSLAEKRRAKFYNVNAPRGQAAAAAAVNHEPANQVQNGAGTEEHETELQKAERLLQDEEDEDEEDYVDEDYEDGSSDEEDYGEGNEGEEGDGDEEEYDEEGEEVEFDEEAGGYEDEEEAIE